MWMIAFLLLPLVGIAYIGWHLWTLLPLSALWRSIVIGSGVVSFALLFTIIGRSIDRLPLWIARCVYEIGTSSIFVMLYLAMLFLLLDLGRLVRLVPRAWLHQNAPMSIGIAVLIFAVFLYGNLHYKHKVRQELSLHTEKPLDKPLRVVMMSDLHLGYHNPKSELQRWVELINREQPDMVLIAGDIIDMSVSPLLEEDMAAELRRVSAPIYACLGNHEYYSSEPKAQRFFHDAGIHLLQDESVTTMGVTLIGRDDRTNSRRATVAQLAGMADKSHYTILLDHQPYHLEQAEQAGIDFQFSGHTHHGQVWPISWITEAIYECAFGSHQRGHTQYYVSSGLGIWGGKFRIGTRSEYVVATISNQQ